MFLKCFRFLFVSGQDASHHATYDMGTSYGQQDESQEADYTDDVVNLGAEGCEDDEQGYHQAGEEAYTEEYSQEDTAEMSEDQIEYTTDLAQDEDDGYQDEVLDIQITEPLDGEFQVSSHFCLLRYRKSVYIHTQTHVHIVQSTLSLHLYYVPEIMSVFLSRLGRSQD